jgi:hypothetical protein
MTARGVTARRTLEADDEAVSLLAWVPVLCHCEK